MNATIYIHLLLTENMCFKSRRIGMEDPECKVFYKSLYVEERLQETWWAGTWHKVRKGLIVNRQQ